MTLNPRIHQIAINQTISTAISPGQISVQNLGRSENPTIVVHVNCGADPKGVSPSLAITLYGSLDGASWYQLGTLPPIVAAGQYRLALHDVLEPLLSVVVTPSSGATFPETSISLLMTSPDA